MGCFSSTPKPPKVFAADISTFQQIIRIVRDSTSPPSDEINTFFKKNKIRDLSDFNEKILQLKQQGAISETQYVQFQKVYEYQTTKQRKEPLSQMFIGDEKNKLYELSYSADAQFKNPKRILVIGALQEGKSLFINALGNSLLIGYPDIYRYLICYSDQSKDLVQECNIMEDQIQYQFLEVPGYTQDEKKNQIIMRNTYQFLREKKIGIDFILICRKYSSGELSKQEKQLIFNLTEIFSKAFIKKCIIINTQHDGSSSKNEILEASLNRINRIYDLMPEPKQLYVNSKISQADQEKDDDEGFNQGLKRFESIERVRDSLLQIFQQKEHAPIFAIEEETFNYRREEESRLQHQIQQLKQSLIELKPTLQNYFAIFEKNENDEAFFVEQVTWQELDQEDSRTIELKELLDIIILNDSQQKDIEKRGNEKIGLQNRQRLNTFIEQEQYKLKMIIFKDRCKREKNQRLDYIHSVSQIYIGTQQNFLHDTFWETYFTASELINKICPLTLKRYLAQELYPEDDLLETSELQKIKRQLREEFNQIKLSLGLKVEMNDIYQTQLLQGVL